MIEQIEFVKGTKKEEIFLNWINGTYPAKQITDLRNDTFYRKRDVDFKVNDTLIEVKSGYDDAIIIETAGDADDARVLGWIDYSVADFFVYVSKERITICSASHLKRWYRDNKDSYEPQRNTDSSVGCFHYASAFVVIPHEDLPETVLIMSQNIGVSKGETEGEKEF